MLHYVPYSRLEAEPFEDRGLFRTSSAAKLDSARTRSSFTRAYVPHPSQIDSNLLPVITAFTTTSCAAASRGGGLRISGVLRWRSEKEKERERERGLKPSVQNGGRASFIPVSRSFRRRVVRYSRPRSLGP